MPTDPYSQLEMFRQAVALLGGQRAAARTLHCNERTLRALHAGEKLIHDGWLRDMAAALARHADACRIIERAITPAFRANLTPHQIDRMGQPDSRRFDHILYPPALLTSEQLDQRRQAVEKDMARMRELTEIARRKR